MRSYIRPERKRMLGRRCCTIKLRSNHKWYLTTNLEIESCDLSRRSRSYKWGSPSQSLCQRKMELQLHFHSQDVIWTSVLQICSMPHRRKDSSHNCWIWTLASTLLPTLISGGALETWAPRTELGSHMPSIWQYVSRTAGCRMRIMPFRPGRRWFSHLDIRSSWRNSGCSLSNAAPGCARRLPQEIIKNAVSGRRSILRPESQAGSSRGRSHSQPWQSSATQNPSSLLSIPAKIQRSRLKLNTLTQSSTVRARSRTSTTTNHSPAAITSKPFLKNQNIRDPTPGTTRWIALRFSSTTYTTSRFLRPKSSSSRDQNL